jgi:hypothetical protein
MPALASDGYVRTTDIGHFLDSRKRSNAQRHSSSNSGRGERCRLATYPRRRVAAQRCPTFPIAPGWTPICSSMCLLWTELQCGALDSFTWAQTVWRGATATAAGYAWMSSASGFLSRLSSKTLKLELSGFS